MRRHDVATCFIAGAFVLAGLALGSRSYAAEPRLLAAPALRDCICLLQSLEGRKRDVELRQAMYTDRQAAVGELDRTRRERYRDIDENDSDSVRAFKRLLERRRDLQGRLRRDILPDYRDAVLHYNQIVARYDARCGNAGYTDPTMRQARDDLVCVAE